MTVKVAWLRLYFCIMADTQEMFDKAYSYGTRSHATSGLFDYVSGQRKFWYSGMNTRNKKKDKE